MFISNRTLIVINMLFLLILIGCASNYPVTTSTGRPEILIQGVEKKDVINYFLSSMLSQGFYLHTENEHQLIFGKKDNDPAISILVGSRYDTTPEWRYTFNVIDFNGSIKIYTNIWIVTNPGSAFERVTDLSTNTKAAQDLQAILEDTKSKLETFSSISERGKVGLKIQNNVVIEVVKGMPAEKAGLKVGDIIINIDGIAASDNDLDSIMQITGEPGTAVKLTIKRDDKEIDIEVIRERL